jgi:hypothetical protein
MSRRIGDDGPHAALCIYCGLLRRGSYGLVETEAAIHRAAMYPGWHEVKTILADEVTG